jgi:hypothetical protein
VGNTSLCLRLAVCALVGLTPVSVAEATITSVTVNAAKSYEHAANYTYARDHHTRIGRSRRR